ncbi:MAG: hypothetical protein AB1405_16265 [Bdellovibrionota bacterium]
MSPDLLPVLQELSAAVRELREILVPRQVTSVVTVTPEAPGPALVDGDDEQGSEATPFLSPLSGVIGGKAGSLPQGFDSPVYRLLFQTLRNAQADYKTEVTFIQYEPDLKQKLLEFRSEEDSYLLLTGLKFNYLLLKNFYAVFQIYVNDEPLMNPDGYKVLSPFSVTDRIPFLKVIDPGSRVEVYMTLKPFESEVVPDVFALLDQISQSAGTALGEDTNTYLLVQSGALGNVLEWYSDEITFENIGQYTVHAEADLQNGVNFTAELRWEWLSPENLPNVILPLDQSPVILNVGERNARGRLHYIITLIENEPGPEIPPNVQDIRLLQTHAQMTLDWGHLTVVNTLVRGIKLPRDVFQSFGESI